MKNLNISKIFQFLKTKEGSMIFSLIIIGVGLRLWNIENLFHYTMDEEVMNLIQRRIVLLQHFPLIGSVSPLSTYLGPIFYYFGAAILGLSGLNPLGLAIFGALLGGFNIFLIYWVAKELFNKKVGILAALFYSTSFLMVIFDRRYWHLTPGPVLSLLVLWSIYKIKQGNIKFIYLLTGALIFGWNTDYTNLVLFLFTFLAWFFFKLPIRRKEVLIAILIFALSNLPLVLFDLRHDYLNSKAFVSYFTSKLSKEKSVEELRLFSERETLGATKFEQGIQTALLPFLSFSRAIYTFSTPDIAQQQTYCKPYIIERNRAQGLILPALVILLLLFFVYLTFRNKGTLSYKLVISFYLIFQLGVMFYSLVFHGDVFEHYLSTLLPYWFIILGVIGVWLIDSKLKPLGYLSIAIIVLLNFYLNFSAYNSLGYSHKLAATKFALEKVGSEDFSLDSIGSCFRYDGFYYPFILNGRHPVKSYQDPNYSWLYDYSVADKHPKNIIVMVANGKFDDEEFKQTYQRYQKWVKIRKRFGNLEVLILDNSKGDFH